MNKYNIVLIGFMGSGKTTIGKRLSLHYKKEFIDTDDFIEKKEGMKISEIFQKYGEEYFREKEEELCERFSIKKSKIISTGGGIIKNTKNMDNLKEGGKIFYLQTTAEKVIENLKNDNTRPLLQGDNKYEKVKALLEERTPLYEKYADHTINVCDSSLEYTVSLIESIIDDFK